MKKTYFHPVTGKEIQGLQLVEGAKLNEDDMYVSRNGNWEKCPCDGLILGKSKILWVRPKGLSRNAKEILIYLFEHYLSAVSRRTRSSEWVVVPHANFNWDPRVQTPILKHPECLKELKDFGLLCFELDSENDKEVYVMRELGIQVAIELKNENLDVSIK